MTITNTDQLTKEDWGYIDSLYEAQAAYDEADAELEAIAKQLREVQDRYNDASAKVDELQDKIAELQRQIGEILAAHEVERLVFTRDGKEFFIERTEDDFDLEILEVMHG